MEGKEKLIVITGATGSGKTTVRNYLVDQYHVGKVITHTTRSPRKNEKTMLIIILKVIPVSLKNTF
ncbi:AAA family ATPase [Apilactobacillus micheneri]|uniref:AAA family ATPase n=1 Tax=Apilactobacillus micheneri TaxID=1899430 RepID=UPI002989D153|nr:AAA family ATPase [Apilactobacillus micheneri]